MKKFMELLKEDLVDCEDIYDYIEQWQYGPYGELSLHEFLGMTWEEYSLWIKSPSMLEKFIK